MNIIQRVSPHRQEDNGDAWKPSGGLCDKNEDEYVKIEVNFKPASKTHKKMVRRLFGTGNLPSPRWTLAMYQHTGEMPAY